MAPLVQCLGQDSGAVTGRAPAKSLQLVPPNCHRIRKDRKNSCHCHKNHPCPEWDKAAPCKTSYEEAPLVARTRCTKPSRVASTVGTVTVESLLSAKQHLVTAMQRLTEETDALVAKIYNEEKNGRKIQHLSGLIVKELQSRKMKLLPTRRKLLRRQNNRSSSWRISAWTMKT